MASAALLATMMTSQTRWPETCSAAPQLPTSGYLAVNIQKGAEKAIYLSSILFFSPLIVMLQPEEETG